MWAAFIGGTLMGSFSVAGKVATGNYRTGWDGREVVRAASGPSITVDGKKYQLLGYDAKGSPVYQDAQIVQEQEASGAGKRDVSTALPQESVANLENDDKMRIGLQFFAQKSQHAMERSAQRALSDYGIDDAIAKPLFQGQIVIDDLGRKSVKYIGKEVTVIVNPDTGEVITAWKTGSRIRRKYEGGN